MPRLKNKLAMLRRFLQKPYYDKINSLNSAFCRLKGRIYYRRVFGSFGQGTALFKPMLISNPRFIHIGRNVVIREGVRLEAVIADPENLPELHIGDNVNIEQFVHIAFAGKVRIGNDVSITTRCTILGAGHPHLDVDNPVKIGNRLSGEKTFTEIGDGSFLGVNTTVMMNARVGKYVIVGANSVVRSDLPDYCVAVGSPATVVSKYDPDTKRWISQSRK